MASQAESNPRPTVHAATEAPGAAPLEEAP